MCPPRILAGGQGLEPRLMASKATVLPLDDPPIFRHTLTHLEKKLKTLDLIFMTCVFLFHPTIANNANSKGV